MRLIAAGRSDKEIAGQLGMSPRTVRTHLERMYMQHGFKSRSAAVSEWLRQIHEIRAARPHDECPYPRPFPEEFHDCPAFQSQQFMSLDLSDRPLAPVTSCRHLQTKQLPNVAGRWYGACRLGDEPARAQWALGIGSERLQKLARLRHDMLEHTGPFVQALWVSKSQQLRAIHGGGDATAGLAEMQAMAEAFLERTRNFLADHQAMLDEIGLPPDAIMELIRFSVDRFIKGSPNASWQVPDAILDRFPPDARTLLMPGAG
jgi:hypothetical protein